MFPNRIVIFLILALGCTGCAHVFSEEILKDVNENLTFANLKANPEAHKGQKILLGGVIVDVVNQQDDTRLEVYSTELDKWGEPVELDDSQGRFLAYCKGYLDSAIYRKGRRVSLVGTVMGEEVRKLNEADYHYPAVDVKHLHLWKIEPMTVYADHYPYDWWYWPPYPYYAGWRHHWWYRHNVWW